MENGMMLYLRRDDMFPLFSICLCRRFQRPVISLRSSGRKVDLIGLGAKRVCDDIPLCRYGFFIRRGESIHAGWISELLCIIRKHRLHNLRRRLCRRSIIQIYKMSHMFFLLKSLFIALGIGTFSLRIDTPALQNQFIQFNLIHRPVDVVIDLLPYIFCHTAV